MVLRYAHLAPEKLSSVASRIECRPCGAEEPAANEKVAPRATFPLRSLQWVRRDEPQMFD